MIKRIITMLFAIGLIASVNANDADFFSYDQNAVEAAVSELNTLENYIISNPTISTEELVKVSSVMVNGISLTSNPFMSGEPALGIPSFLWGCCLGVVGALIVYILTDNDKEEFKKALWGCVTSYLIIGSIYLIAFTVGATTATTSATYY